MVHLVFPAILHRIGLLVCTSESPLSKCTNTKVLNEFIAMKSKDLQKLVLSKYETGQTPKRI